jgi:predicted RNA binding protein YcfA (HicA-like mRNA interferase family)
VSRRKKLIDRFLHRPETIGISEIRQLLTDLGYEERSSPGSHCVFHRKGAYPICVPTVEGVKVKRFYVQRLVETLHLEELDEHTQEDR